MAFPILFQPGAPAPRVRVVTAIVEDAAHPLSYLLVLPLMFAALAYAPRYVIWLALLAVACAAGIGSATPHPQAAATLIMVLATGIAGILTVGGAANRARLQEVMVSHGFDPLPSEWWHFDFRGWEKFELLDLPLE